MGGCFMPESVGPAFLTDAEKAQARLATLEDAIVVLRLRLSGLEESMGRLWKRGK